jgi:C4-type Zn-finger protein
MRKDDALCPACKAGFQRIEILSQRGRAGEVHCPVCNAVLEVVDGSTEVAYRLTVAPEKMSD